MPTNRKITFTTDAGTLAIFDPQVLSHRIDDVCDWWSGPFHELPELAHGRIALVALGGDGTYQVRVTDGELTQAERSYAIAKMNLGLEVAGEGFAVCKGELLPGEGDNLDPEEQEKFWIPASPGNYSVEVYSIYWWNSSDWQSASGRRPASAPADLVVVFKPRKGEFPTIETELPLLESSGKNWVFPAEPRRLGPKPGMILQTKVILRGGGEKALKPCGPMNLRPVLADMTGLAWKDMVEIKVIETDLETETFKAELIRKLPAG